MSDYILPQFLPIVIKMSQYVLSQVLSMVIKKSNYILSLVLLTATKIFDIPCVTYHYPCSRHV